MQPDWAVAGSRIVMDSTYDDPKVQEVDAKTDNYYTLMREAGPAVPRRPAVPVPRRHSLGRRTVHLEGARRRNHAGRCARPGRGCGRCRTGQARLRQVSVNACWDGAVRPRPVSTLAPAPARVPFDTRNHAAMRSNRMGWGLLSPTLVILVIIGFLPFHLRASMSASSTGMPSPPSWACSGPASTTTGGWSSTRSFWTRSWRTALFAVSSVASELMLGFLAGADADQTLPGTRRLPHHPYVCR